MRLIKNTVKLGYNELYEIMKMCPFLPRDPYDNEHYCSKVPTWDLKSGVKFVRYSREFVINRNRYNRVWLYRMIVIDKKLKHLLTFYQLINLLPSKLKKSAREFYWFFHVCCCLIKKHFWKWKKDELLVRMFSRQTPMWLHSKKYLQNHWNFFNTPSKSIETIFSQTFLNCWSWRQNFYFRTSYVIFFRLKLNYPGLPLEPLCGVSDRWSLFRGFVKTQIGTSKWWSLLAGGRYSEVVASSGLNVLLTVY